MAITFNADTTNGAVIKSDTSGEIKLQSAGTDIATVNSSGVSATTFIPTSSSAPTNGMYLPTTNTVGLSANSTERMRIDGGSGSIRIGSNNAYGLNEKVMIYGSSTANQPTIISSKEASGTASSNHFLFQNTNGTVGSIATQTSTTYFNTSSDYRLKENVTPMSEGITKIKLLKPCTWTWKIDGSSGQGFVAHEVQEVIADAVYGQKDAIETYTDKNNVEQTRPSYQGIDQSKLVPLLTSALQEAITKIEDLETRIQALEAE